MTNEHEQSAASPEIPAGQEPKIIKRYTNRKLYDTVESRYVTLDEIAGMIKAGVEVKIIDNKSKEDLTSVTLAQIVFEEEKKSSRMPLSVLREIIRHPGESLSDFMLKEVNPRVASIREEAQGRVASIREEAQGRIGKLLRREGEEHASGEGEAPPPAPSPAKVLEASQRTFEEWQRKVDERIKASVENLTGNLPAMGRDLQALMHKLETLEAKVAELEKQRDSKQS
ncbi:MAG TPA: polyhydroxyalkanoate synthesis regulator DNA-binding domain-containing protein [Myxococcaceae bacterium]|nr:polyhydroxyalkanoate synthesis regulator DNA-binding domain-containing protein [Myxococcaceae bacterium]